MILGEEGRGTELEQLQASYCPTMYITMYMTYEHKIITLNTQ